MKRCWAVVLVVMVAATVRAADDNEADPGKPALVPDAGGHHAKITQILFTPDAKRVVTASVDRTVRVWDTDTGMLAKTLWFPNGKAPEGHLLDASLSADGKLLAVGGHGYGKSGGGAITPVYVVSMETYEVVRVLKEHDRTVSAVAFAPTGTRLATADQSGKIVVWDAAAGTKKVFAGHPSEVHALAWSPDGTKMATVGSDPAGRVWSADQGRELATLKLPGFFLRKTIAWGRVKAKDGKEAKDAKDEDVIAASIAEDKKGNVWADSFGAWRPDGTFIRKVPHAGTAQGSTDWLGFGPSGVGVTAVVSTHDTVRISRFAPHGKETAVFANKNLLSEDAPRGPCALSHHGKLLAVAGDRNRQIYLYDTEKGGDAEKGRDPIRTFGGRGQQVTEVGWKAAGPAAREVVWRTALPGPDFKPADPVPKGFFQRAFSFDQARTVPVGAGPFEWHRWSMGGVTLRVNKADVVASRGGKDLASLRSAQGDLYWARESAVSLLTPELAVVGRGSGFNLFKTATGEPVRALRGHDGLVLAAAPSPDGKYVLGGGDDQIMHVWDPNRPDPILNLFAVGSEWVAWTPEGYYAASPGGERLVGWVVNAGFERLATFYAADRFRKQLHRPDVVKLVLEKGSVAAAVAQANAAITKANPAVKVEPTVKVENLIPPTAELVVVGQKDRVVEVRVKATAGAGQPIQSLGLMVNGRSLPGKEYAVELKSAPTANKTWTVELPPGRYELTALVRGSDSLAASPAVPVNVLPAQADKPVMHVLCVGVNDYTGVPVLKSAVNDAQQIAAAFADNCAGPANHYREVVPATVLNKDATKKAVLAALAKVRDAAAFGDTAVFFFAGHGVTKDNKFYLLTVEADLNDLGNTAISGAEFRAALAGMKCSTLVILDACQSAASINSLVPATDESVRVAAGDEVGVTVLVAAGGNEPAAETKGNGLLTKALKKVLAGDGLEFDPYDRTVYALHLFVPVLHEVRLASGGKQNPYFLMPWAAPRLAIRAAPPPKK